MNPKTIATFIVLVIVGTFSFSLLWPKISEIQKLHGELSNKRTDALIISERIETTRKAISQFEGLSAGDMEVIESALPDDADLPNLFVLIESLVASAGLIGENIEVDESLTSLGVSLTLRGEYGALKAFLREIEKSLRIFDLESITFSAPDNLRGSEGGFVFGIKMKTYINNE